MSGGDGFKQESAHFQQNDYFNNKALTTPSVHRSYPVRQPPAEVFVRDNLSPPHGLWYVLNRRGRDWKRFWSDFLNKVWESWPERCTPHKHRQVHACMLHSYMCMCRNHVGRAQNFAHTHKQTNKQTNKQLNTHKCTSKSTSMKWWTSPNINIFYHTPQHLHF